MLDGGWADAGPRAKCDRGFFGRRAEAGGALRVSRRTDGVGHLAGLLVGVGAISAGPECNESNTLTVALASHKL